MLMNQVFLEELGYNITIPDRYDYSSIYLKGTVDDKIVGCSRLIISSIYDLPIFEYFEKLSDLSNMKCAEISRLAMCKEYRGKSSWSNNAKYLVNLAKENNINFLLAEATLKTVSLYKHLGFKVIGKYFDPTIAKPNETNETNAVAMGLPLTPRATFSVIPVGVPATAGRGIQYKKGIRGRS